MKKLLNEWRKYLEERVVKPTEGTPEALRKSRKKGHEKAGAEKDALDAKCAGTIAAIRKRQDPKSEETDMTTKELACIKDDDACKQRCINCKHKGDWMNPNPKIKC